MASNFLSQLEWRRATKAFDEKATLSDADLQKISNAIRFTPTSFGLQPFYVKVVKDAATKQKFQAAGWNQVQFTTCSAVLVFVAVTDMAKRIDEFFTHTSGGKADVRAGMKAYEDMMKGALLSQTPDQIKSWTQKQAYIALGFALAACAELGIDSCPMEGFDPAQFDKILNLPNGHYSTVVLTVGKRAPSFTPMPQFRFPQSDLIRM